MKYVAFMRRFTRPTNAFSIKVENRAHAVALHMMDCNLVHIDKTLRVTPAAEKLWQIGGVIGALGKTEAAQPRQPLRFG